MYILFNTSSMSYSFCPYRARLLQHAGTQGVASLALGYVLHWAFSPPLLNPKLE